MVSVEELLERSRGRGKDDVESDAEFALVDDVDAGVGVVRPEGASAGELEVAGCGDEDAAEDECATSIRGGKSSSSSPSISLLTALSPEAVAVPAALVVDAIPATVGGPCDGFAHDATDGGRETPCVLCRLLSVEDLRPNHPVLVFVVSSS